MRRVMWLQIAEVLLRLALPAKVEQEEEDSGEGGLRV
jgi:hypothetical protein